MHTKEELIKEVKLYETNKKQNFMETFRGTELKEFMGTQLKKLIVNNKEFNLYGIEIKEHDINFYVNGSIKEIGVYGNPETHNYNWINSQLFQGIKYFNIFNNVISIEI